MSIARRLVGISAAAFSLAVAACGEPEALQEAVPKVSAIAEEEGDGQRHVFVTMASMSSPTATTVFGVGDDVIKAADWIVKAGGEPNLGSILFRVETPTQDQYGERGMSPAFQLRYSVEDLKRINYADITPWQMLNLADLRGIGPIGRQLLDIFCADPDHLRPAAQFCLNAGY